MEENFKQIVEEHGIDDFIGLSNKEDIVEAMNALVEVAHTGETNMYDFRGVRRVLYHLGHDWIAEQIREDNYPQVLEFISGDFDKIMEAI